MNITNRIENIVIAIVAIVLTVIFLEIVRIQPLKKQISIQKVDFDKRIDKQNAIIVDLAKIEKYKIENRFDKLKAKDGQIVLQLDNKLTALSLDSIKAPVAKPAEAKKTFFQKLKFW